LAQIKDKHCPPVNMFSSPGAIALQQRIPFAYRFLVLWFEPLAAANGAFMAAFKSDDFLAVMTPRATPISLTPQFQIAFEQLAATYFLFAFNEAIVLRLTSELSVWKGMLLGIGCCDAIHIWATGNALGKEVMMNPMLWRAVDWVNLVLLYVPITMRLAFVFGVGIRPEAPKEKGNLRQGGAGKEKYPGWYYFVAALLACVIGYQFLLELP
jgi:hypothetical protein